MGKGQLSSHQQEVFDEITQKIKQNLSLRVSNIPLSDRFLSLIGAAGTGKSYLTSKIVEEIDRTLPVGQYEICVTAPTHKALKVLTAMVGDYYMGVKCCTIHSFLNMKQSYNYSTGAEKFVVDRARDKINRASLLIVDESSMISYELFQIILEVVKKNYVNTVLFIGDQFQLLPINEGSNDIFRLKNQFTLTQIVRQAKDSQIIQLSTRIRKCIENQDYEDLWDIFNEIPTSNEIEFFNDKKEFVEDFYKNENWQDEDKILASFSNRDVEGFNKIIRNHYWKEQGVKLYYYISPNDKLRFKKPCFRNDSNPHNPEILYQNGQEIKIRKAEFLYDDKLGIYYWNCIEVGKTISDSFNVVDPYSMEKFNDILNEYAYLAIVSPYPKNFDWWERYFIIKDSFADVQYIFASTIHKLQGSTYETAYIDLKSLQNAKNIQKDFLFRLVYVAITRAKNCVKILY